MCSFTYFRFVSELQGSENALFNEDALVSAVLCLPACSLACLPQRDPWTGPPRESFSWIAPPGHSNEAGLPLFGVSHS